MKRRILAAALPLLGCLGATARQPESPLPAAYATVSERTVPQRRQVKAEEREQRQQRFMQRLDSLVSSGEFQFLPISMEMEPDGSLQMINNFYYYVGVFKDSVQVHLPVVRGKVIDYTAIANFDTREVSDFQTSRTKFGWETSLSAKDGDGTVYTFNFNVYTSTGEAVLNLVTGKFSIKYIGSVVPNEVVVGEPLPKDPWQ